MATLQQIRDAIDARLAVLWPTLVSRQNTYFALRGRYFQGLATHAVPPTDGNLVVADRLSARPDYQLEDWTAFGVATWTEAFSIEVHQYVGPLGAGWVAFARVTVLGQIYVRAKGQGPEDRDVGWRLAL
jgi:hypothetical protein